MDLIAVLKAEFDEAVGDYEGAWEIYLAEFVYRWHSDGEINEPRSPACYDGGEACREIARAGHAMDAARARYEAAMALVNVAKPVDGPAIVLVPMGLDRETLAYVRAGWACLSEAERRALAYDLVQEIVQPWHLRGRAWGRFILPARNNGGVGPTPYQPAQVVSVQKVTVKLGE